MQVKHFKIRLQKDYLMDDQMKLNEFLSDKKIIKTSTNFITGVNEFWSVLVFFESSVTDNKKYNTSQTYPSITNAVSLTETENKLFESLKKWRSEKASKLKLPQYMICQNTELIRIVKMKPKSTDDLINIKGFGDLKRMKYGQEIIHLLQAS